MSSWHRDGWHGNPYDNNGRQQQNHHQVVSGSSSNKPSRGQSDALLPGEHVRGHWEYTDWQGGGSPWSKLSNHHSGSEWEGSSGSGPSSWGKPTSSYWDKPVHWNPLNTGVPDPNLWSAAALLLIQATPAREVSWEAREASLTREARARVPKAGTTGGAAPRVPHPLLKTGAAVTEETGPGPDHGPAHPSGKEPPHLLPRATSFGMEFGTTTVGPITSTGRVFPLPWGGVGWESQ
mmetsp:Transcript_5255/g.11491  ORF Transcript_5255/g.11491 Transcript_5255/m.11491 type:complete len:235 (-) Transcript_5255:311-1015(-)